MYGVNRLPELSGAMYRQFVYSSVQIDEIIKKYNVNLIFEAVRPARYSQWYGWTEATQYE